MKSLIKFLIVAALTFFAFAEEAKDQPTLRIGAYVELPGARGFLRYSGEHSGVRICALSFDIGSAVPSGDFRLYVMRNNRHELMLSLPMLSRKGYSCSVQGDILSVHVVTSYEEKPEANNKPVVVINLSHFVNAIAASGPRD